MAERKLEKVSIVPSEDGRAYHVAASWMTGGNGREAEISPERHATAAEAAARAKADYGVDPEPGDPSIDRRP